MKLDALRTFCAVVETRSFHAAAKRIHRSQPAVSQQIKALEEDTGHLLIERKGCRLTQAGERLYERARHILGETESLIRELKDLDETHPKELRVGTSDTTALYLLPPAVRAFSDAMPNTRLVVTNRRSGDVAEQVLSGDLDLGIVTLPVGHAELEERQLFSQDLVLVAPKSHPMSAKRGVRLHDLREESFLLLHVRTRTGALLREHFRACGFEPQVALDGGSFEVIKRYTAEGIGLSFLPRIAVTDADEALATVAITGLPSIQLGAIWRRHSYRTKAAQHFLALVERHRPAR